MRNKGNKNTNKEIENVCLYKTKSVMNKYIVIEIYLGRYRLIVMSDNLKLINFSKVVDVLFDLCFICCHRTTVNLQIT